MLLGDFLKEGISRLGSLYPAKEAREIILSLIESRLGVGRYTYATDPSYIIAADSLNILSKDLDRLASGEPLQYVLGYAWFYGRRFRVTPDVLIPRPETEILCDEAIKSVAGRPRMRVLDLCTGSGCIAWTLALEVPGSTVYGVDISEKALAVASGQDLLTEIDRPCPEFLRALPLSQAASSTSSSPTLPMSWTPRGGTCALMCLTMSRRLPYSFRMRIPWFFTAPWPGGLMRCCLLKELE